MSSCGESVVLLTYRTPGTYVTFIHYDFISYSCMTIFKEYFKKVFLHFEGRLKDVPFVSKKSFYMTSNYPHVKSFLHFEGRLKDVPFVSKKSFYYTKSYKVSVTCLFTFVKSIPVTPAILANSSVTFSTPSSSPTP